MLSYVSRRLLYTVILLLIVSLTIFFIFDWIPVDPARLICTKQCTPSLVEANRHRLGLDVSVLEQWWRFLVGLFAGRTFGGDGIGVTCAAPALGYSFSRHACVTNIVAEAFPITFSLALGAFVLWLSVGVSLGVLSARKKGKFADRAASVFVLVGTSLPTFISGILVVLFIVLKFNLVNPLELGDWHSPFVDPMGWLRTFFFPCATLALAYAATYTRFTRSNVIETSSEDFIRTARAKGLSEKVILRKHTLRAALAPIVTIAGLDFAGLLGGAIITEGIFGLNGLGKLSIKAVTQTYDLPIILATTLIASAFVLIMNLIVDIAYAFIDPRVRTV
jgi:peptide/nickel transport system permease protein